MTTFTVWKFDDPDGADRTVEILRNAQADGLVKVDDHAVVRWPVGQPHPDTRHGHESVWHGAGWGAVMGLIIGTLFFMPVAGGLAGAALGGLAKKTEDAGITRDQLEKIRAEVTEGTSALFVVTEQGDLDRLGERMHGLHNTLVTTNLTEAERSELLEALGGR
ncbi:DUF1269 domain-containing protein [Nucisporomicrobium flavum]|uniref:DUF1269 domain-containing protein n=1 Tax=Nucisporomicrobium flavum TaxID=2785915 RepID=UPI0018F2A843|nr:DUF1269 domain-containing protein [Nucisporomicrobium flavum]